MYSVHWHSFFLMWIFLDFFVRLKQQKLESETKGLEVAAG